MKSREIQEMNELEAEVERLRGELILRQNEKELIVKMTHKNQVE